MVDLKSLGSWVRANASLEGMLFQGMRGTAEYLADPSDMDQLAAVVCAAKQASLSLRILGEANNVLVGPEPVKGVVLRLNQPLFREVKVQGRVVRQASRRTLDARFPGGKTRRTGSLLPFWNFPHCSNRLEIPNMATGCRDCPHGWKVTGCCRSASCSSPQVSFSST